MGGHAPGYEVMSYDPITLFPWLQNDPYKRDRLSKLKYGTVDGAHYEIATDGYCAVAVVVDAIPDGAEDFREFARLVATQTPAVPVNVAELRAFCAAHGGVVEATNVCPECKGKGTTVCDECHGDRERECDMGHWHECPDCDGLGSWTCEDCGGKPGTWMPSPNQRTTGVRLLTAVVNPVLVHTVLGTAPTESVAISTNFMKPIVMRAPNWIGVVMPLRADVESGAVFP